MELAMGLARGLAMGLAMVLAKGLATEGVWRILVTSYARCYLMV